ncbi:MAG: KpsF/GutQ family sugar-phosphate isomerase [Armatimonadetes bacterium]|nr:KpsF/GutQ family sugar-phosphate isomerase [Armatimonadota bacterium]MDE2206349.1 KpsF/GutQ family sugar-phosphate isomerase [Armatimonadota bacterium]
MPDQSSRETWLTFAQEALGVEAEAILHAAARLDGSFLAALDLLDGCRGKIVVSGVGKSGIVARKLAATLTSTGAPAVFLHPTEAMHGDLGLVAAEDVLILISHSGESEELLGILPAIAARGVPIISIIGNLTSTLAERSSVHLDASIEREICPLNLAPTASVITALAVGDALAMALHGRRGLKPEDYALNHPGGRLGRRLTMRVADVMMATVPSVGLDASLLDVLGAISAGYVGAACVLDEEGGLLGLITDNDVRRSMQSTEGNPLHLTARQVMNPAPAVVLTANQLAWDALNLLENRPRAITVAPVVDEDGRCVGMVRVHDLVRAGLA